MLCSGYIHNNSHPTTGLAEKSTASISRKGSFYTHSLCAWPNLRLYRTASGVSRVLGLETGEGLAISL